MYEMGVQPERVAKLSGIGCSSKSPAYFMNRSHSFNSVHGRMPSVATGAMLANSQSDCSPASAAMAIPLPSASASSFTHAPQSPMIYIIEDNGVYGLTKGQFSAHCDLGSKLKSGVINDLRDRYLRPRHRTGRNLRGPVIFRRQTPVEHHVESRHRAPRHRNARRRLSLRDFQRSRGSTKSYKYVKDHDEALQEMSFVPHFEEIDVEYDPGTTVSVTMHDGSTCNFASWKRITIPPTGSQP